MQIQMSMTELALGPVPTTVSRTKRIHKVLPAFQVLNPRSGVSANVLSTLLHLPRAEYKDTTCITAR